MDDDIAGQEPSGGLEVEDARSRIADDLMTLVEPFQIPIVSFDIRLEPFKSTRFRLYPFRNCNFSVLP